MKHLIRMLLVILATMFITVLVWGVDVFRVHPSLLAGILLGAAAAQLTFVLIEIKRYGEVQ